MHFKILLGFHKWVIWLLYFMFVWFNFSVRMETIFICMNQNHYLLVSLTSQIRLKNFQNFLRLSKMQEEDLKLGCPLNIKFCREKYIRVYVFWQPEMIEIHGYTYMQTRILINRLLVTKNISPICRILYTTIVTNIICFQNTSLTYVTYDMQTWPKTV